MEVVSTCMSESSLNILSFYIAHLRVIGPALSRYGQKLNALFDRCGKHSCLHWAVRGLLDRQRILHVHASSINLSVTDISAADE